MPLPVATVLDDVLTRPQILEQLRHLVSRESDVDKIKRVVEGAVANDPERGKTKFNVDPQMGNNASYNFNTDTLTSGSTVDPAYVAHELGHAENTANSPIYQKLLMALNGLNILNQKGSIPIMLGLHAFAGDDQRRDIVNTLSGVSGALAGGLLTEEASATANAIMNSENKLETARKLAPALGSHAISSLIPILLYQVDRRL